MDTREPVNIDLSSKQRAVVQQMQRDHEELSSLEARRDSLLARINANRGKLELIAELAAEYGSTGGSDGRDTDTAG